jgi:hypothetical protein
MLYHSLNMHLVVLGGVIVSVSAIGPKVRGFKPAEGDKNRSTTSVGGEVKAVSPMSLDFTAC